jgi:hypothetical protein
MSNNLAEQLPGVLDLLSRGPAVVRKLIQEMPAGLLKRRPTPGVWSAHEHAVHLPAVQPIMIARLERMLAERGCVIRSYEPSRDDQDGALLALDLDAEMDRFARERAALVERLRTLTPDQWAITADHEEYSHYSIFIMFRHIGLHDYHHAYKIEERLLRKWD